MQVLSWHWERKGEPETLVLKETELRDLEDHEVLVQNTAIGLNPVDWKLINTGHPNWIRGHVPGVDGAGIVVATGKEMVHIPLGTRVCYHTDLSKNGSFSTKTIIEGRKLMFIPTDLSAVAAAAFPCPSLTAWQAIKKIPLLKKQDILVNGAGGSVGYLLTQLLLEKGANVYVTASVQHHKEFREMGVVNAYDYKDNNWKVDLQKQLGDKKLDVVFDTVSGTSAALLMELLGYYGHIVSIQDRIKANPLPGFTTCISMHEIALGAFHQFASEKQIVALMAAGENLMTKIANGKLKQRPLIIGKFDQLNITLQYMKTQNSASKYVIKLQ